MVLDQMGEVSQADDQKGIISGNLTGSEVTIKIEQVTEAENKVTVSARKMMLPKPEIAKVVLYQITQKLVGND